MEGHRMRPQMESESLQRNCFRNSYVWPDTIPFTKELEGRADYFQAKCFRNILKIQAAYYSRVSNKEVLDAVSMYFYDKPGKISPMSRQISDKAVTLLGHILRSKPSDHSRCIAIDAEYKRVERTKRRVGRPRFYWLQNTMKRAYKLILKSRKGDKVDFDMNNYQHRKLVAEMPTAPSPPLTAMSDLFRIVMFQIFPVQICPFSKCSF